MFKVNNKDTRTTPCHTPCFSVSIVNFEHVIAGWVLCPLLFTCRGGRTKALSSEYKLIKLILQVECPSNDLV